ncbi:hypothetical protein JZ751_007587 [Albula glossodonta]|uniref:Uncharacterized protein n=1 Tax=Albula glossodonta TaxID=121402 RepID=A0A8T2N352_9TELE|nr:hypothetical protein JZ751_007587 [Albula glossodonta]
MELRAHCPVPLTAQTTSLKGVILSCRFRRPLSPVSPASQSAEILERVFQTLACGARARAQSAPYVSLWSASTGSECSIPRAQSAPYVSLWSASTGSECSIPRAQSVPYVSLWSVSTGSECSIR